MDDALEILGYRTRSEYVDAVVQQVRLSLRVKVAALLDSGAPLMEPADLVAAMVASVPDVPARVAPASP